VLSPRRERGSHGGTRDHRRRDRHRQRPVRQAHHPFETGLLAQQAAGSVAAYLDDDTMLLSATTAGKHPKDHFDFFR
jgi:polyribonucleotide nucleotidyltransferase